MSERIAITESELLADLLRDTQIDDDVPADAMTVSELAAKANLGVNAVQRRLKKYEADGRLRTYRVVRRDTQGRPHPCNAYVLLPDRKAQPTLKRA